MFFMVSVESTFAVVAVKSSASEVAVSAKKEFTKKQLRVIKRKNKKQQRLEKRLKKFQKKWEHKSKKKKRFFGGITDEPKFQLGLIFFVAGLIIGIFDFIPLVGWAVSLAAGVLILAGVVLMIWTIFEGM